MGASSRHWTSAGAALLAVIALLAALRQLPQSLRSAQAQIQTNAGLTPVERELDAARANDVHQDLALRAAEILPRNAIFYVATNVGGQGTVAAPAFYAYWL